MTAFPRDLRKMESRRLLLDRLSACGLDPSIDGTGHVDRRQPNPSLHLRVGSTRHLVP